MRIIRDIEEARQALARSISPTGDEKQEQTVRAIVNDVRKRGDKALIEYTSLYDGVKLKSLEVNKDSIERAYQDADKNLRNALETAATQITAYHVEQKEKLIVQNTEATLGWLIRPLETIGVYAPGFQAPLPSTVLMTVIPAKVAGVKEIVLVTPPQKTGEVSPVTLAAAKIAGVDRIFTVGGAQSIAALAYGTESIPAVDKICGPGNIWVTLAKKQVNGDVGIDGLYGPSEVVIIADETANARYIAADLLAQAEHGSGPTALLITISDNTAVRVDKEIELQLMKLSRHTVTKEAIEQRGAIIITDTVESAIELANFYAPEHLCLVIKNADRYMEKVKNTGCLFIGENSLEALVDYAAGPSHVLPTGGTARFDSGLNITDFVKIINTVNTGRGDIRRLGPAASIIARAEGLDAHARAVDIRLEDEGQEGG
jgi:histidinol dehydrogenase